MNPSIGEPENLQRSEWLRQLAALDRLEPSPDLDRAVLERARKAIRPAHASGIHRSLRWLAPVAAAVALAVIAPSSVTRPGPSATRRDAAPARIAYAPRPRLQLIHPQLENVSATLSVEAAPPPLLETEAYPSGTGLRRVELETEMHPAEWLSAIRRLRAAGRKEEATRQWNAFRKAYPGYPGTGSAGLDDLTLHAAGK